MLANALEVAAWVLPVVFAITVHEAAHAFAAWRFGDTTARDLGRLTLNPLPHVSMVGTVLVPALAVFLSGMAFGWAKPVPVNLARVRSPRTAMVWVALAGPLSNLIMLVAWSVLLVSLPEPGDDPSWMGALAIASNLGVLANLILMVFNLLPVPPLDGGRVVMALLPTAVLRRVGAWHHWVGLLVVVALVLSGIANRVMVSAIEQWIAVLNLWVGG
ncbi:MAG: site-2 protease family protein [Pseudomonadota bacterium]